MRWECVPFPAVLICALLLSAPLGAGVLSNNCRTADQPAATLLIPYFEVDLSRPDGATTLISINNASSKPALARVVMWTDWGVPTLAFDVYLTGYDIQSLNLRDLFAGSLAGHRTVREPAGARCPTRTPASTAATRHRRGAALAAARARDYLRAAHTGQPLPGTSPALCLGSKPATTAPPSSPPAT